MAEPAGVAEAGDEGALTAGAAVAGCDPAGGAGGGAAGVAVVELGLTGGCPSCDLVAAFSCAGLEATVGFVCGWEEEFWAACSD